MAPDFDSALAGARAHHPPLHELLLLLETDTSSGLTEEEARARLAQFGPNELPVVRAHGPLIRFLLQFHHPLIYVLLVAGTVTLLLGELPDASVIFAVVLVNAVVGFLQERRAEQALEALKRYTRTEATVVRDGKRKRIPSSQVVPGDLLLLDAGDKIAADARVVWSRELQVDESLLTGESVPVRKYAAELPAETELPDRVNMVFSGTLVTAGQASCVVVATGAATELGRIHQLLGTTVAIDTPLMRKIARFSKQLTAAILALAALTFAIGLWRNQPAVEVFLAAVALAVGAIPEGLPAAMTITLAIGVARMARRNAIIRKLPAVETLGSTTVICSDKTGTLTENKMTVQTVIAGGEEFSVTGLGYAPQGQFVEARTGRTVGPPPPALRDCLLAGVLCNEAALVADGDWRVVGDPTEGALLVAALKCGIDFAQARAEYPRLELLPFDSSRQYMASLHRSPQGELILFAKGAAEALAGHCTQEADATGAELPFDPEVLGATVERLAGRGLRVLAFARRRLETAPERLGPEHVRELVFLGLQGMIDPPRPEAIASVALCHQAGIWVKMITGDHAGTARAIAHQLALAGPQNPHIELLTGRELTAVEDHALPSIAERTHVFARVLPEQKLRLVRALQSRGHVVAMTGDGVNDAPALRQADIGVAMGSGTEVAKEAAAMVLTDDNFHSIVAAVEEGRAVFDNLQKFLVWTLPTNMGEGLILLAAIAAGTALPVLPVQILWINMSTALCLGMMLAFEPKEPDIMRRPPRDPSQPVLTRDLLLRTLLVASLMLAGGFTIFSWELAFGASLAEARTAAANVIVLVELFYLWNCRRLRGSVWEIGLFSSRWVNFGAALMILLQVAFAHWPPMNALFHTAPVPLESWLRTAAIGLSVALIVAVEKALRARFSLALSKATATA